MRSLDPLHPEVSTLPERLRQARERRRLSQSSLSLQAGLSRTMCGRIEAGTVSPNLSIDTILRLARALEVCPAWLAFGLELRQDDPVYTPGPAQFPAGPPVAEWHAPVHQPAGSPRRRLPALEPALQPLLAPLGPYLDHDRRLDVSRCLVDITLARDPELAQFALRRLSDLLRPLVSAPEADAALGVLSGTDPIRRGKQALALIADADLPIPVSRLEIPLGRGTVPAGLQGAVEAVIEIWDQRFPADDERWLNDLERVGS
jgi:DNA-binding XRE family transcriptional regulator